jgi:hypothetical protein
MDRNMYVQWRMKLSIYDIKQIKPIILTFLGALSGRGSFFFHLSNELKMSSA